MAYWWCDLGRNNKWFEKGQKMVPTQKTDTWKEKKKKEHESLIFFFLSSENNNWIKLFEFVEG